MINFYELNDKLKKLKCSINKLEECCEQSGSGLASVGLTYNDTTNELTFTNSAGVETTIPLIDVNVTGGSFDATTQILTLTSDDGGPDVTINLSAFLTSNELPNFCKLVVDNVSVPSSYQAGIALYSKNIVDVDFIDSSLPVNFIIDKIELVDIVSGTVTTETITSRIVSAILPGATVYSLDTAEIIAVKTDLIAVLSSYGISGTPDIVLSSSSDAIRYEFVGLSDPAVTGYKVRILMSATNTSFNEYDLTQNYTSTSSSGSTEITFNGTEYSDGTNTYATLTEVLAAYPNATACETVTTLVDNNDSTFTYTSEDGTETVFDIAEAVSDIENNLQSFSSQADALAALGPDKTFYWLETNIEGVPSPNNGTTGRT